MQSRVYIRCYGRLREVSRRAGKSNARMTRRDQSLRARKRLPLCRSSMFGSGERHAAAPRAALARSTSSARAARGKMPSYARRFPEAPGTWRQTRSLLWSILPGKFASCSAWTANFLKPRAADQHVFTCVWPRDYRFATGTTKRNAVCVSENRQTLLSTSLAAFPAEITSISRICCWPFG